MSAKVLGQGEFRCDSEPECRCACPAENDYWEGQLSHVGRHYDLIAKGRALRVAVIGKDNGRGPARISMADRYKSVHDDRSAESRRDRNPHIQGVTLALRTIFGVDLTSESPDDEILSTDAGEPFHLFDAYALVNALLCTCTKPGGNSTSAWRPTMRKNCGRHLAKTIEILEPTLIITQGARMHEQSPLRSLLVDREQVSSHLFEATIPTGGRALVCTFSHPYQVGHQHLAWSRVGEEASYFNSVVRPTLQQALKRLPRAGLRTADVHVLPTP